MGTYNRAPTSNGDPVIRAAGWGSGCAFHTTEPSATRSAYTIPLVSPKKAVLPWLPIEMAVLTVADALKLHHRHPVAESSEYTVPSSLPTNNLPSDEVGWPKVASA